MKVAIVGAAGRFGAKRLQAVRRSGDELVAACDVLSVDVDGIPVVRDYRELLQSDAELVCLALPDAVKLTAAAEFLAAGKHVLAEKPLAMRADDVTRVFALARSYHRSLYVGYNLRFFPSVQRFIELLRSGELGELTQLRMFYGHGGAHALEAATNWRTNVSSWGGSFVDMGTHLLSIAAEAVGPPERGMIAVQRVATSHVEDAAYALFEGNGVIVSIASSWTAWRSRFSIEAYGREGFAELEGLVKYVKYGQDGERLRWGKRAEGGAPETHESFWSVSPHPGEGVDPISVELEYLDAEWSWLSDQITRGTYDMGREQRVSEYVARVAERFYS